MPRRPRIHLAGVPLRNRWSSYPANALGQRDPLITPHPLYTALAADEASRQAGYRTLFRHLLDAEAIGDIRYRDRQ